jgi:L-ascorbate metabolism protein UlaG (beta-lactamase superfamily)
MLNRARRRMLARRRSARRTIDRARPPATRILPARLALALSTFVLLPRPGLSCGVAADLSPSAPGPTLRLVAASGTQGGAPQDLSEAPQPSGQGLRFTFLGHASFLIETPGHISAVTDYNGINIPDAPPTIATMNHAHPTHYTLTPDPRITYVLHGWRDDGGPAKIDLTVGDMHIFNLPTNIRSWDGGGTEAYGNSVFVFESGGLCVAHLGHLHHLLTQDDLAYLGPIDVVMAPVDGTWTLSLEDIATVIDSLHAPITVPMHYYERSYLNRFLAMERGKLPICEAAGPVTISRETLPADPEILILPGPPG